MENVGTLHGELQIVQRHVSLEDEHISAEMVERYDGEVLASGSVPVDADADHSVLALYAAP